MAFNMCWYRFGSPFILPMVCMTKHCLARIKYGKLAAIEGIAMLCNSIGTGCGKCHAKCHSIPQSKNTLLNEHMASAKNTSIKGTARGMPDCKQKQRGLISSKALWNTVTHAVRIQADEGRGINNPTMTEV
mmetsp:Transcript_23402/g.56506  ORF Transcript_23402/g.56506 Transcript_23402/m.56506 type:complete len:131 (-) Transcript_23402:129-521(-)